MGLSGTNSASDLRVKGPESGFYGGSVKPSNSAEILLAKEVNGALIGGASLKAADFLAIAAACP